ncbi:diaminopimelate epimerase [Qingshengfaniella alkalisoli]|uniref:Diaminopimelate epimerase n=1 Tax=Qingshengfaniella alkalisoli TaxID=2599296 RepID=A0A5B8I8H5_9RHOB|nr:diaminopimelate epimerase [Qingshengfaniella alkalisoli]QDY70295.1 diaminopimelate epimerase [Qingshengfaniella alkalisoli]
MRDSVNTERLAFLKMHGLGNDFVIVDSRGRDAVVTPDLARKLGDRHRGVGYDQLAEIRDGRDSDIALDFWNSDGTRAGACGNATRCVADIVMDAAVRRNVTIRTARGLLSAKRLDDGLVSVNMGLPESEWDAIPLARPVSDLDALPLPGKPSAVGMGNPHCVFFVEDADSVDVEDRGPSVENDPLFPEATNVEFVHVIDRTEIRMRVWERGTGITLACGSGACAAAVAAHRRGLIDSAVTVRLDGGPLHIRIADEGVWMTGATAKVFEAELDPSMWGTTDG